LAAGTIDARSRLALSEDPVATMPGPSPPRISVLSTECDRYSLTRPAFASTSNLGDIEFA
jgi:hypothetical protein